MPESFPPAPLLMPVSEGDRIRSLDVLRGFALFGILMVNMQFFAMPFVRVFADWTLYDSPWPEKAAWTVVKMLFEYKFVTLFSLLFGMGLVVQLMRAQASQRPFTPVYLRRLAVLGCMGLIHALLLWYGDILFIYAVGGLVMLLCLRLRPRTLLWMSAGALIMGMMWSAGMTALQVLAYQAKVEMEQETTLEAPQDASTSTMSRPASPDTTSLPASEQADRDRSQPLNSFDDEAIEDAQPLVNEPPIPGHAGPLTGWEAVHEAQFDPTTHVWYEGEVAAFRDGPLADALLFRWLLWLYCLLFTVCGFGWHVLAMFFLGAALMKLKFFSPSRRRWHVILTMVGVGVGLPLEAVQTWITYHHVEALDWAMLATVPLHELGSAVLGLGYAGGVTLLANSGAFRSALNAVAAVGRMSLTNYLTQTIVVTCLMYWWGCGWFNELNRPQQVGLVVLIYSAQMLFSMMWLKWFIVGPAEWLWRSLTYLKLQPVLRRRRDHGQPLPAP